MTGRTHDTATGTVTVHDQGAHLTEWRVGEVPVIWVSQASEYAVGTPIRGGVPVCWPWFGPGRGGDLTPAHGFARIAPWRLLEESTEDGTVRLLWELTPADVAATDGAQHFPHAFTARVEVTVSESATISLTVRNDDTEPWDFEAALHTYLHVGDIRRVRLTGLEGTRYFDKVLQSEGSQEGQLSFSGETDRVYRAEGAVQVHDPVLDRTLVIEKAGSANTVVWNPWVDKAAAMSDFQDGEWPVMVCVEAASVGDDAVRLEPGAEHTLSTTVQIRPLDQS